MSHDDLSHPVPRGGIDPIRSRNDALAVLALGAPYGHDTVAVLLDADRCGHSVMVVTDTGGDHDCLFRVIDALVDATQSGPDTDPRIEGVILASSRPDGDAEFDDIHRWLEASDHCRAGGLELVEWFVLGRSGPQCPREMFGDSERWVA